MAKRGVKGGIRRFVAASAAAVAMVMFAPTAADAAAAMSKIGAAVEPHTIDAQAKEHDGFVWRPKKHSNRGFFFVEEGAQQKKVVENDKLQTTEGDEVRSADSAKDSSAPETGGQEHTGDSQEAVSQGNSMGRVYKARALRGGAEEHSEESQAGSFMQNKDKFFFSTKDGKEAAQQQDQGSFMQEKGKFFFSTKDGKEAAQQQDQGSFMQEKGKFFFSTKDGKEAAQQEQPSFISKYGNSEGDMTAESSPGMEQDRAAEDQPADQGEDMSARPAAVQDDMEKDQELVDQEEASDSDMPGSPDNMTMPGETNDSETSALEEGRVYKLQKGENGAASAMQLDGSQKFFFSAPPESSEERKRHRRRHPVGPSGPVQ